jgi:hypothetical protein
MTPGVGLPMVRTNLAFVEPWIMESLVQAGSKHGWHSEKR